MDIIGKLRTRRTDRTTDAWKRYAKLIRLDEKALAKSANATALEQVAAELELSPDDIERDIKLLRRHASLVEQGVTPRGLHEQARQAGIELKQFEEITIPQTRARLRGIISNARVVGQSTARARGDAEQIERHNPQLFGGAPRPPAPVKPDIRREPAFGETLVVPVPGA